MLDTFAVPVTLSCVPLNVRLALSISLLSLLLNTKRVFVKLVARTLPPLTLPDTFAEPVIPNSVPLNVKLALSTNLPPVSANTTRVLVKLLA